MRTLLFLLLLCWVSSTADGLTCYVCDSTTTNSVCNKNSAPCQAPLDTCMSTVVTAGSVTAIVKQCSTAKVCSAAASVAQVVTGSGGTTITCCNSDLCNYSGATTARLHTLLLALPLCAISALCYISS